MFNTFCRFKLKPLYLFCSEIKFEIYNQVIKDGQARKKPEVSLKI